MDPALGQLDRLATSQTITLSDAELASFCETFAIDGDCQSLCVLYFTRALMGPLQDFCAHRDVIPFVSGYSLDVNVQEFFPNVTVHTRTTDANQAADNLTIHVRAEFPDGRTWVEGTLTFTLLSTGRSW